MISSAKNPNSEGRGVVYSAAIQTDGRILLAGNFTNVLGISCVNLARLNSDGSVDRSFQSATGVDAPIYCVVALADGGIGIGGAFTGKKFGKKKTEAKGR